MSAPTEIQKELVNQLKAFERHIMEREGVIPCVDMNPLYGIDAVAAAILQAVDAHIIGEDEDRISVADVPPPKSYYFREDLEVILPERDKIKRNQKRADQRLALWGQSKDNASKEKDV
ncbi:hypothetical protein QM806_04440 [Rhodococcus sp. IEGM 1351]|uniref:hypothetical protein n=1 Tax=Rhodococcus sp. IEGM 1351 TaxID=3047089 RepID=UPI0024B6A726|nr:hypothetical protein [Rhodococcus sp. IEGM 1351]MDI9934703.1 hypothetical protein [Rhodococcus sp. IEGM 1351]